MSRTSLKDGYGINDDDGDNDSNNDDDDDDDDDDATKYVARTDIRAVTHCLRRNELKGAARRFFD